jgi:hypothetical protein
VAVLEAEAMRIAGVDGERAARYEAALGEYEAAGTRIVAEGPERSDFNALRIEHGRRDETLYAPATFAAWLAQRIAELRG